MSLPERLLDLAEAAHAARIAGHSEVEIARAAGCPEVVRRQGMSVEQVIARNVAENHLTHPEDIAYAREFVEDIARQLGISV